MRSAGCGYDWVRWGLRFGEGRLDRNSDLVRVGPAMGILLLAGSLAVSRCAAQGTKSPHRAVAENATAAPSSTGIRVTFTDVAKAAGLKFKQDSTASDQKLYLETMGTGVAWIDYDQDGLMDLFFVQSAATDLYQPPHPLRAVLYHNNGDGTFTDVTAKAGVADQGGWSTSAGWFDYDKDGWLDLVVTNYIEWTPKTNLWCGERRPGYRSYCHPGNYKGQKTKLYHNNHDGTFTDVSDSSGVGKPESKGMGVVLADFNNDGW